MMEKCYDEGTLQAFLDNELAPELSNSVARHVADCDPCALLLAEVEEETAFVFNALGEEMNTLVPTHRLWTKINQSIEAETGRQSAWQRLLAWIPTFSLTSPQFAGFASLLFIAAVVFSLVNMKPEGSNPGLVAQQNPPVATQKNVNPPVAPVGTTTVSSSQDEVAAAERDDEPEAIAPRAAQQYRVVTADYRSGSKSKPVIKNIPADMERPSAPQFLPGEEAFVSTIARLERTVNESKDEVLKPSARYSYERNMAVVDDAIRKMKQEVRKNPKNQAARQILFASYQNKIELLNSVTERSELMASLR